MDFAALTFKLKGIRSWLYLSSQRSISVWSRKFNKILINNMLSPKCDLGFVKTVNPQNSHNIKPSAGFRFTKVAPNAFPHRERHLWNGLLAGVSLDLKDVTQTHFGHRSAIFMQERFQRFLCQQNDVSTACIVGDWSDQSPSFLPHLNRVIASNWP